MCSDVICDEIYLTSSSKLSKLRGFPQGVKFLNNPVLRSLIRIIRVGTFHSKKRGLQLF